MKARRRERILFVSLSCVVVGVFFFFTLKLIQRHNSALKNQQLLVFKEKERVFLSYINDGDNWFEKGKWKNAIFYYERAKAVFPKNYDANYRLVRTYSLQCERDYKNCNEAKALLGEILLTFPEREKQLLGFKDILQYEYP
ncbi:MAG: hypothetical protein ACK5NB_11500 [Flavobacteriaceae bacterium]